MREGRLSPELGARILADAAAHEAEAAAKAITDPATWEAAYALNRAAAGRINRALVQALKGGPGPPQA